MPAAPVERVAALDWGRIATKLDMDGCAVTDALLTADECAALAASYAADEPFRSRVIMARHGFGRGEYKYFAAPLPPLIAGLRAALYAPLARIANRWSEAMRVAERYPAEHAAYLARCHKAGQEKPTPLLLRYGPGDYNCLHQDLYGEHIFPLQVAFLLSRPQIDFTGGEFVLVEQRPRMQSRAEVVPLAQGQGVIFPVHHRPVEGTRGTYRVNMRHGVSRGDQTNRNPASRRGSEYSELGGESAWLPVNSVRRESSLRRRSARAARSRGPRRSRYSSCRSRRWRASCAACR
jgi:hypothetical protein